MGSEADVLEYRGDGTVMTDLEGRTLVPGLIDGHAHVGSFGTQALGASLLATPDGKVETVEDLVAELQSWAVQNAAEIERFGMIFGTHHRFSDPPGCRNGAVGGMPATTQSFAFSPSTASSIKTLSSPGGVACRFSHGRRRKAPRDAPTRGAARGT